ncbi:hypothetical protein CIPAW_01G104000 [Carya illinoinensis]|uniref:Uncharacterized protein n=1 Tax=Carya illinoinensis TaxID=32201 RepID=A0A8T1RK22_CARIL|nr:hypothetical protein CIPAW_01G104000 [Carya illinoinensis]
MKNILLLSIKTSYRGPVSPSHTSVYHFSLRNLLPSSQEKSNALKPLSPQAPEVFFFQKFSCGNSPVLSVNCQTTTVQLHARQPPTFRNNKLCPNREPPSTTPL